LRLMLLGPPGAGKGTQADMLIKELEIPHISTGDMFRAAIANGTELGKKAKAFMDAGHLVPDEVTVGIVRERLSQPGCAGGFILDGFPRTIAQADALGATLEAMGVKLDTVIHIQIGRDDLIARLTGRRVCRSCGSTYHVVFNAPRKDDVCDQCGGELYQRGDDTLETVANRLDVYERQTEPLLRYYQEKGLLVNIDGTQAAGAVCNDILKALGREPK
jgi:adenylate kinase